MKKLLSLSAGILFTAVLAAQAIPNGGFENWSNISFYDLNGYQTANDDNLANGFGLAGITAIRSTPGVSGNYSLFVETKLVGPDTVIGYATNGIQNPLQPMGGIPWGVSNPMPTGISFYYSCSVQLHDTAAVLAVFKKSGTIIGTYIFPFIGNIGTYTLFANALTPALLQTPDTVVFAVVSSLPAVYDNNNAKGCLPGTQFAIDSVKFTGAGVSNPPGLNGNFESWTSDTDYIPTGWNSSYPGVFQTTDFHAGSFATQLKTKNTQHGTETGFITTGNINNFLAGGLPYTRTADTFEFYYKYTPALGSGDSAFVNIQFKKSGTFVGAAGGTLKSAATYTLVKYNITLGSAPDSVVVSFSSSKTSNPPANCVGSVLKVDNVMFKSNPLAVLNVSEVEGIKVYPNPVTNSFNLNTEGFSGSVQSLEVYDMTGRVILSASYASGLNNTVTSFDMSRTSPGIYIVKVLTSTGVFYQKISKIE